MRSTLKARTQCFNTPTTLITSLVLVELSLAQFDYMHCAENVTPQSVFKHWPYDVELAYNSALATRLNWTFNIQTYNLSTSFVS